MYKSVLRLPGCVTLDKLENFLKLEKSCQSVLVEGISKTGKLSKINKTTSPVSLPIPYIVSNFDTPDPFNPL